MGGDGNGTRSQAVERLPQGVRRANVSVPTRARPLILLVDDHQDSVDMYASVLGACDYDVTTATDVATALAVMALAPPDLVVTDLEMPVATGWILIETMRRRDLTMPVIVLSAHAFPDVRQRAADAAVAGFLTKPCLPRDLEAAIARALGRVSD